MFKRIIPYFLIIFISTSCEKTIQFDLAEQDPKLVVEATIENDKAPVVFLSRSINFFSTLSADQLVKSFVHHATVTISDGTHTQQLTEYEVPIIGDYSFYYYSVDTTQTGYFKGELKHAYTLSIDADSKQYTATTTIPDTAKRIDSIWWKQAPSGVDSSKAIVMIKATDPKGFGNYVRYFTKRNSDPFYPGLNSVYDDLVIDGITYEIQVEPGVDRNAERNDEDHYFDKGDTVEVKLSNIDKATYDFWRTMEYSYASVGNPFSTPAKVLGNISNGALGYFGGYASQYRTIIIPQ